MRLHAALAIQGLAYEETDAEAVIEHIRHMLYGIEPDAEIGIELLSVGTDFGGPLLKTSPLDDLLTAAQDLRGALLRQFWRDHDAVMLQRALRLGHAIASMNPARIRQVMDNVALI